MLRKISGSNAGEVLSPQEPLYVARPIMPELSAVTALLQQVWDSRILTNEGPLHNRLEGALADLLQVPVAKLFNNGTVGLQCALLSLGLAPGAEVITTPLTFAATAHAIAACGLTPIFADVDEDTLTLDPEAVARAITPRTGAVLAVHVYGTLCDHQGLDAICRQHGLKLVYDAAHAFAATQHGAPVGMMGDLSVFSLHATKLYNTFEGGLVTSPDPDAARRLRLVRNFGIESEERVTVVGINGKMSELNAAIGLLNLDIFEEERRIRRDLRRQFDAIVDALPGIRRQVDQDGVCSSEQYYPIVIDPDMLGATRDDVYDALKQRNIMSRKYFWPICTDFDCYKGATIHSVAASPVVDKVKNRVLCLPFHSGVEPDHVQIIAEMLNQVAKS